MVDVFAKGLIDLKMTALVFFFKSFLQLELALRTFKMHEMILKLFCKWFHYRHSPGVLLFSFQKDWFVLIIYMCVYLPEGLCTRKRCQIL